MTRKPFTPSPAFRSKFRQGPKPVPKPDHDHPKPEHTPHPDNDLIFGIHAVAAALANQKRSNVYLMATENAIARLREETPVFTIETQITHPRHLDHLLVGQDAVHQGAVLEAKPLKQPRLDQVNRDGIMIVLDQVTDPHNVGAILRSCAAFNVTALVTTARHAATANGTLLKSASGAYELVPMVTVTNLARALEELRSYGFFILGLDSEASEPIEAGASRKPLALVMGAEGKGLRQLTCETCDLVARLDMPGAIKSLNVSVAAAISLYALTR
jgi:23S rRNA (guanosine2251-2'-O)-methyltransferase